MNEKMLEQLKDWGLTSEQLVTLVGDLKTLSEGATTINFLGNGNHLLVVGNYFAASGGGKVKSSGRRRQRQSDDFDHEVEPDDEVEADDAPWEQEASSDAPNPRDNPPSSNEAASKTEVTDADRDAHKILLKQEEHLGEFDPDIVTKEAIAEKGCAQEIINVKDDVDKIDEVLEKHFPDLDA